jgi:site-specific DNA-methyltransferase (adenine-specific)
MELIHGDCLEEMDKLIEKGVKVDAVITDLPYGMISCKWDVVIPFEIMWSKLNRIADENTPIIFFGTQPFTTLLISSNLKGYKHSWVWNKKKPSNSLTVKYQPLKNTEDIIVFTKKGKKVNYYPILETSIKRVENKRKTFRSSMYGYSEYEYKTSKEADKRYPKHLIEFSNASRKEFHFHPTQKPIALMEYLIKTYTKEKDLVLDFTMGSGSTGVACANTNRDFIGIELDENYFNIAKERIKTAYGGD